MSINPFSNSFFISDTMIMQSGRHRSVVANSLYQDPTAESLAHRSDVLTYNPDRDGVQIDGEVVQLGDGYGINGRDDDAGDGTTRPSAPPPAPTGVSPKKKKARKSKKKDSKKKKPKAPFGFSKENPMPKYRSSVAMAQPHYQPAVNQAAMMMNPMAMGMLNGMAGMAGMGMPMGMMPGMGMGMPFQNFQQQQQQQWIPPQVLQQQDSSSEEDSSDSGDDSDEL